MNKIDHKAGFVNIIGLPNVGKSTLLNTLMGEKMAIVTPKPQTTRQRLFGIYNDEDMQIVFSDSPGFVLKPSYRLHEDINNIVRSAFEDADVIVLVTDKYNEFADLQEIIASIEKLNIPKIAVINKKDKIEKKALDGLEEKIRNVLPTAKIFRVSALYNDGIPELFKYIKTLIPEHPPYYPKEDISDKPLRFFTSEIIREKIFLNYRQEIPYSSEVIIEEFKDEASIARIKALIYVERNSQKVIILGKKGSAIKKVGTEARKDIEDFIGKKVYLELTVKVREDWRNNIATLKKLGYR